jgi:predicted lactoylglutathione lyase
MRMIFVNLAVKDLPAAMAFYEKLGFSNNPQFTDETAACMVVEENIFVMLLTEPKFQGFINGEIADTSKGVEVLNCLSVASRGEADDLLDRALKAGGKPWKPAMDLGFMYGTSFCDPDGHVWETAYVDMAAMAQGTEDTAA